MAAGGCAPCAAGGGRTRRVLAQRNAPRGRGRLGDIITKPTSRRRRRHSSDARGTLILVGGALTVDGDPFRRFLELSGASRGEPVIGLTSASSDVSGSAMHWLGCFRTAGVSSCDVPVLETREQACDPGLVRLVQSAKGIFLGGGDQVKLVTILGGSPVGDAIREAYLDGAVICGTSAGAAALPKTTLAGNEVDEDGQLVEQYIGPGLGLLGHHVLVDTHFSERRRLYRLFVAVAEYPELMGLGIDEDTALIVNGEVGTVVGKGTVTFVDGRDIRYNNTGHLTAGRQLTLSAMRVGVIGTDHTFNLRHREIQALLGPER